MEVGKFIIPDRRFKVVLEDLRLIYNSQKKIGIKSSDLALLLGYKHPTSSAYYRRLGSLVDFGVLEKRGEYAVTDLGEQTLFPENDSQEKSCKTKCILHVPLWSILYKKHGKTLPKTFWISLKSIADIPPDKAQKIADQIQKWYEEDMMNVSEDITQSFQPSANDKKLPGMNSYSLAENSNTVGTVSAVGIGTINVVDIDTLNIAKSYLDLLEKKLHDKLLIQHSEEESINLDSKNDDLKTNDSRID